MRIFLVLAAIMGLHAAACLADAPQEYVVKAKYLVNIPLFASLPESAGHCASFTICIIGHTPVVDALKAIQARQINNQPLEIKTISEISHTGCCKVLFIAASEQYRLQQLLPEANRQGILTVSDIRDFAKYGGMVSLVNANNRISYDLNLAAARKARISFSAQLLKLANDIRDQ